MQIANTRAPLFLLLAIVTSLLISACAAKPPIRSSGKGVSAYGEVIAVPIESTASERYQLRPGVRYEQPAPYSTNLSPNYPDLLLEKRLDPVSVCIRIVVNQAGHVSRISRLGPIQAELVPFFDAVYQAVKAWKFTPLVRIEDAHGHTFVSYGEISIKYEGKAVTLPFHLDYGFEFRQINGEPSVKVSK